MADSTDHDYPANPVLVIMGVSGVGKTTAAELLAHDLGWDYAEADAFHPKANIEKMSSGAPLTDEDRWPWLKAIAAWIDEHEASDSPAIVTCSALKRSYRDILRRPNVVFIHLSGSRQTVAERLDARQGHFMPPSLLDSQFEILETPGDDELTMTIDLDLGRTPREEADAVLKALGLGDGEGRN